MSRATTRLALLLLCAGCLSGAPAAQAPAFEAASIKQNDSGSGDGVFRRLPGRFTVTNLSMRWIIQNAYGIREYQLVDAPGWMDRRYDLTATFIPPDASQDQVRLMLQRLLAERVGLRVHGDKRQMTVYELTQPNANVLGPKLKRSPQDDCATRLLAAPECRRFMTAFFIKGLWSIPQLTRSLEQVLEFPVMDRTNMSGVYDLDLQWGTGNIGDPVSTLGVDGQAALVTAIREQLGLKLQTRRELQDVIVIDTVSPPGAD